MKVLTNAAEIRAQAEATPAPTPRPVASHSPDSTTDSVRLAQQDAARVAARRGPHVRIVHRGVRVRTAVVVGLLLGATGAAAFHFGAPWLRPGVVVVTSDPAGLDVALDGQRTGQVTPAVIENVLLSRHHQISVAGAQTKAVSAPVPLRPGELVARVHLRVESSVGSLVVDSIPPGAEVRLDDRPAGRTPVTLPEVRLDQRHRIDLVLAGHEIDQFVVLPEKDGVRFTRRLSRAEPKGKAPAAP
jgi:hypothetical protein